VKEKKKKKKGTTIHIKTKKPQKNEKLQRTREKNIIKIINPTGGNNG
jgi:hypothetical protein